MSNAPSKPVSFSRPKVGYFSNRPRTECSAVSAVQSELHYTGCPAVLAVQTELHYTECSAVLAVQSELHYTG